MVWSLTSIKKSFTEYTLAKNKNRAKLKENYKVYNLFKLYSKIRTFIKKFTCAENTDKIDVHHS